MQVSASTRPASPLSKSIFVSFVFYVHPSVVFASRFQPFLESTLSAILHGVSKNIGGWYVYNGIPAPGRDEPPILSRRILNCFVTRWNSNKSQQKVTVTLTPD